jgi:hypothetical protein
MNFKGFLGYLKYSLKKYVSESIWAFTANLFQTRVTRKYSDFTVSNKNSESNFKVLVIRRRPPGGGLFSNVNHVLQGLELARDNGYAPIVDMENYWTTYSQISPVNGSKNAWNYFFEPVSDLSLSEVKNYTEIRYTAGDRINPTSILRFKDLNFMLSKEKIHYLNHLFESYIKLNEPTRAFISNLKEFIQWEPCTMGVSFRGDYAKLEPKGHAVQPELKIVQISIEQKISESRVDKILISTDSDEAQEMFREIAPDLNYAKFRNEAILRRLIPNGSELSSQVVNAFGYLAEIYLLGESHTIVTSIANGPATAFIINGNKYENPVIFNLGSY